MRQKMPPKMIALDTLLMARPMLVALSLLTWRLQHALLEAFRTSAFQGTAFLCHPGLSVSASAAVWHEGQSH